MSNNQRTQLISLINSVSDDELDNLVYITNHLGYTSIDSYKPSEAIISDDTLISFLRAPITGDLNEVPGLGAKMIKQLAKGSDPIHNTYQLIGKYLSLKSNNHDDNQPINCVYHCNKFYTWLKQKGIDNHRATIVMAIGEKVNAMLPSTYDSIQFE